MARNRGVVSLSLLCISLGWQLCSCIYTDTTLAPTCNAMVKRNVIWDMFVPRNTCCTHPSIIIIKFYYYTCRNIFTFRCELIQHEIISWTLQFLFRVGVTIGIRQVSAFFAAKIREIVRRHIQQLQLERGNARVLSARDH